MRHHLRRQTGAAVGEVHDNAIAVAAARDLDGTILTDGIHGVVQDIEDDLLKLGDIGAYQGKPILVMAGDDDPMALGLVLQQRHRLLHGQVDVGSRRRIVLRARESEQPPRDRAGAPHLGSNLADGLAVIVEMNHGSRGFLAHELIDQSCLIRDDLQGVVDFMRHARRQTTDQRHLLHFANLVVEDVALMIGARQTAHHGARQQHRDQHDERRSHGHQRGIQLAGLIVRRQGSCHIGLEHQQPLPSVQVNGAMDQVAHPLRLAVVVRQGREKAHRVRHHAS